MGPEHRLLFISHSSANNRFASEVMDWLTEQGLDNVFLDLDSNAGIAVGEDWESVFMKRSRVATRSS